jgi:PTH1 family peptidyl-tRNA hydrolase
VTALKLIVGLGNPSPQYDSTRHNVGAVWVRNLATRYSISLAGDRKFKGEIGRGIIEGVDVRLLLPSTYMNLSGESVGPVCRFYKIAVDEMLVAYDEMAFAPGVVKLKFGGGDNGHNGIKSVRAACANDAGFHRLRIGVGHPGTKDLVTAYLTRQTMPSAERSLVDTATDLSGPLVSDIVHGEWQQAMNVLHATGKEDSND